MGLRDQPIQGDIAAGVVVASVTDQEITSTAQTTVMSWLPPAAVRVDIKLTLTVSTAPTQVTITVTFTNAVTGLADTVQWVAQQTLGVDTWLTRAITALPVAAATPVDVNVTAGTANQVAATGEIRMVDFEL